MRGGAGLPSRADGRAGDAAAPLLVTPPERQPPSAGFYEAARESLKEALRVRSRPTELRHLALIARGHTYLAEGKKAMARKDYERVLADDASYPGLADMISAVTA